MSVHVDTFTPTHVQQLLLSTMLIMVVVVVVGVIVVVVTVVLVVLVVFVIVVVVVVTPWSTLLEKLTEALPVFMFAPCINRIKALFY